MLLKKERKEAGYFSLREKFLGKLSEDLQKENFAKGEAYLRESLKRKLEKGQLF